MSCVCSLISTTGRALRKGFALGFLAFVLLVGIADASGRGLLFGDFRAFWCAGSAVLHGVNPYAGGPLYACESPALPFGLYHARGGVALPVPLPGYALVPFVALALVPFPIACIVWFATLLLACALAWRSLSTLIDDGIAAIVLVAALPIGIVSIPFGELVPIAVAALCACGAALKRRAFGSAVAWSALAMIEPHVGLPVLVAFVGWRRTRVRAAIAIVVLAALHALVAATYAMSYFTHVLPQHALAELPRASQFSLAWIVHVVGGSPQFALGIGTASYVVAVGGGVTVGVLLAWRTRSPEMIALVPPAFALLGGTFIHLAQMLVALPAILVLMPNTNGRSHAALGASLVLLSIPWYTASHNVWLMPLVAIVAGGVALATLQTSKLIALRIALGAVLLLAVLLIARAWLPSIPPTVVLPVFDPALAQSSWAWWIRTHESDTGTATWLAKMPTWFGLGFFAVSSFLLATKGRSVFKQVPQLLRDANGLPSEP